MTADLLSTLLKHLPAGRWKPLTHVYNTDNSWATFIDDNTGHIYKITVRRTR